MWWPSLRTLHVGLSAQRLAVVGTAAPWSRRRATGDSEACAAADGDVPWQPAVDALERRLSAAPAARCAVRVVLSGRFVRWQLLPWRAELSSTAEVAAFAALRFRETYGKTAEGWRIQVAPQPPGATAPACAIDAALLERLHGVCRAAGARLVEVRPYFSAAFDRWRRALRGGKGWFGVQEPDCLSLALLHEGRWLGLRSQRLQEPAYLALPGLMAQIGIAAGVGDAALPLYLAGAAEPLPRSPIPGVSIEWLRAPTRAATAVPADCRMAMGL